MKHSNVSIFVPHVGCPNKCAFCNQHTISGKTSLPTPESVREICKSALNQVSDTKNAEIAFFGGSFTAIDREYMISLLSAAGEFVGENGFYGIRISTRPDCIDDEILEILKNNKVTAIELGAQSMNDRVLLLNDRGHTADDVRKASELIKQYGFELGLQMMTGLYGSDVETDVYTAKEILKIKPQTVRIYPTVILENTKLSELLKNGEYKPYGFDEAVELCSKLLIEFEENGVKVIKLGLHASEIVESEMVGGFYHPAFRELCESRIFLERIKSEVGFDENVASEFPYKNVMIEVCEKNVSKAIGHKKSNILYFEKFNVNLKIKPCREVSCELKIIEMN